MARLGVSYLDIAKVAVKLTEQGVNPTVEEIRRSLCTGSNTTINRYLREWRLKQGDRIEAEKGIPTSLLSIVKTLYEALREQANEKIQTIEQDFQQKIAAMDAKLKESDTNNHTLRDENNALQAGMEKLQLKIGELTNEKELTQKDLVQQRADNTAQVTRLLDKENEIDRLSNQVQHAQANLEHYRQAIGQQREEEKQSFEAKITRLENKNDTYIKRFSEFECALAIRDKEVMQFEEQYNTLKNKYEKTQEENSSQQIVLQQIQTDAASLKLLHNQLQIDNDEKAKAINVLSKTHSERSIQIAKLEEKLENTEQALHKAEDSINALQDKNRFLAQEKYELAKQLEFTTA